MDDVNESRTSLVLLAALRQTPEDQRAWAEFLKRYAGKIYNWCRHWGLQEADAQDVTQNVLLKLAEKMRVFAYDPTRSFRAWLKTVTSHACSDFLETRRRPGLGSGDTAVGEILDRREARDDLLVRLAEAFDLELLEEAKARVRVRVKPMVWESFRLTVLEGMTGAAAAERLGLKMTTVFSAKTMVQRLLREQIDRLERGEARRAAVGGPA